MANIILLPSGVYLNIQRVIAFGENADLARDMGKRRAVELITEADGGGRVYYDEDADAILEWLEEQRLYQINR